MSRAVTAKASNAPSRQTLVGMLWEAEGLFPERPALVHDGAVLDYGTLAQRVRDAAGFLKNACGICRGERVVLLLANSSRFVVMHYAVLSLGAVVAPLDPQLRGRPLESASKLADPVCVVTDEAHAQAFAASSSRPPNLRSHVVFGKTHDKWTVRILGGPDLEDRSDFRLDGSSFDDWTPNVADDDDPAILFTTSGTTGRPKGILVSHRQALLGLDAWVRRWNFGPSTVSLMVAPFFHVVFNPLVLGAHRCGGTAIVLSSLNSRAATREAERRKATALMGTPALFIQMLQDSTSLSRDLSSVKSLIYGAAPTPVPVIRALRRRFPGVGLYNCYGLTETCSALSCLGPEQLHGREGSVGLPHPGIEVTIRDEHHREVAQGELGEIYCRGPHVIEGYFGAPEADAERFHDGWLRTGDIGYSDEESYLYLVGRADDRINISGEKVYPADIENVLYSHPRVADAAVIGITDARRGQVIKAFVVPAGSGRIDPRELKRFCSKNLPPVFVPRVIELIDTLPRNPSGKIVRRELS